MRALVVTAGAALLAACAQAPPAPPVGALEAAYRYRVRAGRPVAATTLYRGVLARGLGSRCRMLPSDSQAFDLWSRACGAPVATALAAARLYLEVAAGPATLRPVVAEGRVRWLDLDMGGLASCAR